jgi:hypothetical protein
MRTTTLYGFGINITNFTTTVEKLKTYISNNNTFCKLLKQWFEISKTDYETASVEDILDICDTYGDFSSVGIGAILLYTMQEQEDMPFLAAKAIDESQYIVMPSYYPWEMTDKLLLIKNEDTIKAIFEKHVTQLTDQSIDEDLEWGEQSIEIEM